ncbi:hypothetical protein Tco_0403299 [Tanacetum coccineum]
MNWFFYTSISTVSTVPNTYATNINPVAFSTTVTLTRFSFGWLKWIGQGISLNAQVVSPTQPNIQVGRVPIGQPAVYSRPTGPTVLSGQETTLPHAFTVGTL